MSETTPAYKMTIDQTVQTYQGYMTQAESSLTQLQTNIDNANNQINEWRRIQLMIVGQKQLLKDLIDKTVETPATDKVEGSKPAAQ
jgi:hypothetical protein